VSESSQSTVIRFSSGDGVGLITFARPPANAYDLAFHEQFNRAVEEANTDQQTRVVIIHSDVPGFFCAGADINVFANNSTADNKQMVGSAQAALKKIEESGIPYIACLEGHALGGGLEIAMACDIRLAGNGKYKFGLPEVKLGLLPGNGGSQRLPRIVSASQALLLLASGENINPEEATRIGLVDRLFPAGTAMEHARELARAIAAAAPLAVEAAKKAVRDGLDMGLEEALALESRLVDELYDTNDAQEGFKAAAEKRAPRYNGK